MKNGYLLALCGFLIFCGATGWLLGRLAPEPKRRHGNSPDDGRAVSRVSPVPRPVVGQLYSVDNADGGYRIIEVLASSNDSVEVRLFGNHFPARPGAIDKSTLTLQPSDGYAGPGFDSVSVTAVAYALWNPVPVAARQ